MKYTVKKQDYSRIEIGNTTVETTVVVTETREISQQKIDELFDIGVYSNLFVVVLKGTKLPEDAWITTDDEVRFEPENWSDDIYYAYSENSSEEAIKSLLESLDLDKFKF